MAAGSTRIEAVMEAVRGRIASRACAPGARLPSVRAQAKAMGVSVATVVEAYERLVADGVVRARAGSGFYVCGPVAPLVLSDVGQRLDREVDPLWISRQSLDAGDCLLRPGCGWLPADWMHETGMRRALRRNARADAGRLADYATSLGLPALRGLLARRMAASGIEAGPERVMLTESGTQAIDLVCRFLLEPGDVVLVDDPCYFNFHALLRAHRVRAVGVPMTPSGPDVAAFEAALAEHAPRLYITNSGIHNPTGAVLSPQIAHRILSLADATRLVIVEDDIFADFEHAPAPRLAAFDGLSRVVHIGSFSKTLSASLRCGYIAARADWIEGLADLRIATSFGGGHLASAVVHDALVDSGYRRHMDAVRARLADAREKTIARLDPLGIRPWIVPRAGMFLWCLLPDGADAADIARDCLKEGMVLAPGNAFSPSQRARGFLRFNVAQSLDPRVFDLLARALDARPATGAAIGP
ncbi:MAG: PLP-dependent aminotransferase family protein [Lysobacteraceae bacterium]